MDALLIPVLALSIPVVAVVFKGLQRLANIRLEEQRVRSGLLADGSESELTALREEVGHLRQELGEVNERMDFTERMLAQRAERAGPERLPESPG